MGRRRRNGPAAEDIARAVLGLVVLAALGIGGVKGFPQALGGLLLLLLVVVLVVVALLVGFLLARKLWRSGLLRPLPLSDAPVANPAMRVTSNSPPVIVVEPTASPPAPKVWDFGTIRTAPFS